MFRRFFIKKLRPVRQMLTTVIQHWESRSFNEQTTYMSLPSPWSRFLMQQVLDCLPKRLLQVAASRLFGVIRVFSNSSVVTKFFEFICHWRLLGAEVYTYYTSWLAFSCILQDFYFSVFCVICSGGLTLVQMMSGWTVSVSCHLFLSKWFGRFLLDVWVCVLNSPSH